MDESIRVMIYEELRWCWRLRLLRRRPCVLEDLQPQEVHLLPGDLWMNNNPIKVLLHAMRKRFYIIFLKKINDTLFVHTLLPQSLPHSSQVQEEDTVLFEPPMSLVPIHCWNWVWRATYIFFYTLWLNVESQCVCVLYTMCTKMHILKEGSWA